jgi:uncharacterized protein YbjT (DUF2867 family)
VNLKNRILISSRFVYLGASGFIGAHVVKCLLEKGYNVRAVVRDASNKEKTAFLSEIASSLVWSIVLIITLVFKK